MPATSFGYSIDWPTIEQTLDSVTGGQGAASARVSTSVVVGDEEGIPLATGGGLVDTAPISDQWQAVIDTIATMLTVRDREISDYLNAWLSVATMVGVLSGSGTVATPHGVNQAPSRVITVGAWYTAVDGSAHPLTVVSVDGANLNLSGGVAGASYRATLIFGVGV